jgi:hypothetical protein
LKHKHLGFARRLPTQTFVIWVAWRFLNLGCVWLEAPLPEMKILKSNLAAIQASSEELKAHDAKAFRV